MTVEEKRHVRQTIINAYSDGMSLDEVINKFNETYCAAYIRTILRGAGFKLPRRSGKQLNESTYNILAALLNTRSSVREISCVFGVHPEQVRTVMHRAIKAGINFTGRP